MADTDARLNPEILEDLKLAEAVARRFAAAGSPAALWELFALCQARRPLVQAELGRPVDAGPLAPELVDELLRLRAGKGEQIDAVRPFLPVLRDAQHARVQELLLGFVAVSSAALEAAARWKATPDASRGEATRRLALMESIVERYWKVLPAYPPPPADVPAPAPEAPPESAPVPAVEPTADPAKETTAEAEAPAEPPRSEETPPDVEIDEDATPAAGLPAPVDAAPPAPAPIAPEPPKVLASAPTPPSGLVATAGDARVALAWSAVPGATGYRIRRATDLRGPYAPVGDSTDPSFVDTTVVNGTLYFYYVIARNEGGDGRRSSRTRARPMAPPSVPAAVIAAPGDGRVTIAWGASLRAARYRIRRALTRRGPYTLVGSAHESSYTDTAVTNGTTYFYTVVAVNVGGKSPHSAPVQATPVPAFLVPAAPPPAPTSAGEVPVLEQVRVPALGALPQGVDLERLLDLKHLARIRSLFEETAQEIDVWEAFCVIAQDEPGMRRAVEDILRRRDQGDAPGANEGAAAFFERVLRARAEHGALVRDLRPYLAGLGVDGHAETLEIALAFIVSAVRSRKRAARWLEDPEGHRPQAAAYAEHALGIARQYVRALGTAP